MTKRLFTFIFLLYGVGLFSNVISRDQVINMAKKYVEIRWVPLTDVCKKIMGSGLVF